MQHDIKFNCEIESIVYVFVTISSFILFISALTNLIHS
jgi:hypothetical protein